MEDRDIQSLYARLDDLKGRAVRGEMGISAFLSPRELHYAKAFLDRRGCATFFFGGYNASERGRVYILPDYMADVGAATELEAFGYSSRISALLASGSGFEKLSHRDFMGSLLGLGIERSVIGDIVVTDDYSAIVFCDNSIVDFLLLHWEKVGKDKIKLKLISVGEDFAPKREYAQISDTVASFRLDCVVAALCNLSREKSRQVVIDGAVELDYEVEERPDREMLGSCIISIKGYGKFRVLSLCEKTKKGRYRLQAEKFL